MTDYNIRFTETLTRSKFSKYLNETICPPDSVLYNFCEMFDVDFEYMIGVEKNVRNKNTATISTYLGISEDATNTLRSLSNDTIAIRVLNSSYRTYKRKKSSENAGNYDANIFLHTISWSLSLTNYLEDNLIHDLESFFEARLQEDINYAYWREHYPEEYNKDLSGYIEEITEGTISNVKFTITKEEDGQ